MGQAAKATYSFGERMTAAAWSVNRMGASLIKTGKNMQWAGRQITVGLTVPLGFLAHRAAQAAEEFDEQMTRVIKVYNFTAEEMGLGTDAINREIDELRGTMREFAVQSAADFGYVGDQSLGMMADFAQMGFVGQDLEVISRETQRIARLGGVEFPDAINLARTVTQAFGEDMSDLSHIFNIFNAIENETALGVDDLANGLPILGQVAATLGMDVTFAAASLATMKEAGVDAREAATALRTSLIKLVDVPTDKSIKAFNELGISIEELQEEHGDDAEKMLEVLAERIITIADSSTEMRDEVIRAVSAITGVRQSARFLAVLRGISQGMENAGAGGRAFTATMMNQEEAAANAANELNRWKQSAAGTAEILRAELSVEMAQFGEKFLEVMNVLRRFATRVLKWFNGLSEGIRNGIMYFGMFVAVLGPIGMLLGILQNAFGQVLSALTKFVPGVARFNTAQQRMQNELMETNVLLRQQSTLLASQMNAAGGVGVAAYGPVNPYATKRGMWRSPISPGKAFGATAGVAAIAGMGTALTGTDTALGKILSKVTQIFGTMALLAPIVAGLGLPLWGVVAAAGAVAAAIWGIKQAVSSTEDSIVSVGESSRALAQSLGITYKEVGSVIEEQTTENVMEFANANYDAIQKLRSLKDEASQQAFLFEIAYDLKIHGAEEEEIKEAVKRIAEEAGVDIELGVVLDFDTENVQRQLSQSISDAVAAGAESSWFEEALDWSGAEELSNRFKRDVEDVAKIIAESFRITGDAPEMMQLVESAAADLKEEFDRGRLSPEQYNEAIQHLTRSVARFSDVQGLSLRNINDVHTMYQQLSTAASRLDARNKTLIASQVALNNVMADYYYMLGQGAAGSQAAAAAASDVGLTLRASRAAAKSYADTMPDVGDGMKYTATRASDLAGALPEVEEGLDDTKDAADAAADRLRALRSAMQDIMGDIIDSIKEQLNAEKEAFDEMWRDREEALKKSFETRKEQAQKERDFEVKRINDIRDKEKKLADERQRYFDQQRARISFMERTEITSIDIASAIARGELDVAARLRAGSRRNTEEFFLDELERERKARQEAREEELDALEERVKATYDALDEEIEAEEKAAAKRLSIQRKAAEKAAEMRRRQIERYLEDWKKITPQTEAEWRRHLGELSSKMGKFGLNFKNVISDYSKVTGRNMYSAFKDAAKDAQSFIAEEGRWQRAFDAAAKAAEKAAGKAKASWTGMAQDSGHGIKNILAKHNHDASMIAAGKYAEGWKKGWNKDIAPILMEAWNRLIDTDIRRELIGYTGGGTGGTSKKTGGAGAFKLHSGGPVPQMPSIGGLKPGEVPAVLQTGEYVIRKDAVKTVGVDYLNALNKYHQGGLARTAANKSGEMQTGSLAKAVYDQLMAGPGGSGAFARGGGGWWRDGRRWGQIADNTAAALRFIKQQWGNSLTSAFAGQNRGDPNSDHSWGKAIDIMFTRPGTYANANEMAAGWSLANWFVNNDDAFGTKYVIWQKLINSGQGWTNYGRYGSNPGPTLGHYDHVHVSFMHDGGLVTPGFKFGGMLKQDSLINAHKGEMIVRQPLSDKLVSFINNGGPGGDHIEINIDARGTNMNEDELARKIEMRLAKRDRARGRKRSL